MILLIWFVILRENLTQTDSEDKFLLISSAEKLHKIILRKQTLKPWRENQNIYRDGMAISITNIQ